MPRPRVGTALNRYRFSRAVAGQPTSDDSTADRLIERITEAAADLTNIVGSTVAADVLERFAQLLRHAKIEPAVAEQLRGAGLLSPLHRPAHRPRGSLSPRTGYDLGFLFLMQKREGWTIAQIARQAKHLSTDRHDARLTIQAWRARVSAAIKQELAREKLGAASGPFDFANLPRAMGLLDLAAKMECKK